MRGNACSSPRRAFVISPRVRGRSNVLCRCVLIDRRVHADRYGGMSLEREKMVNMVVAFVCSSLGHSRKNHGEGIGICPSALRACVRLCVRACACESACMYGRLSVCLSLYVCVHTRTTHRLALPGLKSRLQCFLLSRACGAHTRLRPRPACLSPAPPAPRRIADGGQCRGIGQ